jgi:UDP-4-amino-4,6-dideoxy-N-acetyl-beta-L-altrosamine transaminase
VKTIRKYEIQYGGQDINVNDVNAVIRSLKSKNLTQGPEVKLFEEEISNYVGSKYSLACNSATSALHLACLSLGIENNKIVWVPATTFVASSNCALYCGATVDFCDVDKNTLNLDIQKLEMKLCDSEKNGSLPDLIVIVHLAGHPADLEGLAKLKKKYKFSIIEDASHAIGSSYHGNKIGSCKYSDITVFSLHPVKIITTGEGGIATTNSEKLYEKMQLLRSHGISRDIDFENRGGWEYDQLFLGFNYRMTDFQAALGRSQLKRLNKFVTKRNQIASYYSEKLKNLPLTYQELIDDTYSSFHLYLINLDINKAKFSHIDCHRVMKKNGINVNLHYMPVYLMPYYKNLNEKFREGYCENSELYAKSAMTIPLHTKLKDEEINYIIKSIKNLFR